MQFLSKVLSEVLTLLAQYLMPMTTHFAVRCNQARM
jgi:hypothetical protein